MPSAKNIIKHIRGIRTPAPVEKPEDRKRAQFKAALARREKKEVLKVFMRDRAFAKAQKMRSLQIEENKIAKQAEEERQKNIIDTRLKNLKKARRTLKKRREGENNA